MIKKKIIIFLIITSFLCSILTGCINDNNNDRESFLSYNLKIESENTYTIYVPFLDVDEISDNELLNKINNNNKNTDCSIIEINNTEDIFSNLSTKSKNNNKALEITGYGNTEINLKINGQFTGRLTLVLINEKDSFGVYLNKSNINENFKICLTCIIQKSHSEKHWNDDKVSYDLKNGWNKIILSFWGGIE